MPIPPTPPISRRTFLLSGLAGCAALLAARRRGDARCVDHAGRAGARAASAGPHPTPRPGIDASRLPPPEALDDAPDARTAFDQVRQIPEIVDGIRCQCGCGDRLYSLLSCYEGAEAMALHCAVCQGQGRLAYRLHRAGKTLDEIRAAIDDRYG